MKKAFGLLAAALVSTSVYSQSSSESSSGAAQTSDPLAQKEQTPDFTSRQTESGAPASADSSSSSRTGYERSPGLSGGNSSTGQSNGANISGSISEDKTLTTRDSDAGGADYRGSATIEAKPSFDTDASASGSSVSGEIGESSSTDTNGAVHVPASPVREGAKSEGWSTSGTFSGAGPGSVSGSAPDATPGVSSDSGNFSAEVSADAGLEERDADLSARGLEPDSSALSESDDHTIAFEDWTVIERNQSVGAPSGSESGAASSSDERYVGNDSSVSITSSSNLDSDYGMQLHQRVQRDWSARLGTDMPATPGLFDRSLDELSETRYSEEAVGAPAGSVSGTAKSDSDKECDTHKDKGASAGFEAGSDSDLDGSVRSSGTAIDHDERLQSEYHINRGDDEKYHINRSATEVSPSSSAPSDYGDRSYSDGHLNGNNAASGSSATVESSGSASDHDENSVKQPDL